MKPQLNAVFRDLRKQGFLAKQKYLCCSTCAWSAIGNDTKEPDKPVVFYHEQDAECIKNGYVYLAFGVTTIDPTDEAVIAVGKQVVEAVVKHGLKASWSGSAHGRIRVTAV